MFASLRCCFSPQSCHHRRAHRQLADFKKPRAPTATASPRTKCATAPTTAAMGPTKHAAVSSPVTRLFRSQPRGLCRPAWVRAERVPLRQQALRHEDMGVRRRWRLWWRFRRSRLRSNPTWRSLRLRQVCLSLWEPVRAQKFPLRSREGLHGWKWRNWLLWVLDRVNLATSLHQNHKQLHVLKSKYFRLFHNLIFLFSSASVVILKPPPPMITIPVGDIFEISCTAVGVPTPQIVWRLNWGHVPKKCQMRSVNGVGTLTCPDIQVNDQGAYSCEAINNRGSVIAVPDTILVVTSPNVTLCPKGYFNEDAKSINECISCFCFGITDECRSADLFIYHLQPPLDSHKVVGVRVDPGTGAVNVRSGTISKYGAQPRITPTENNGVHVLATSDVSTGDNVPYFVMPENYNGNQLKSYGGYLSYDLKYEGYGRPLAQAPDVILVVSKLI